MNPIYKKYSILNYLAFNYAGFASIAIVVFLVSTQPFYIKEVIGIEPQPGTTKDQKIGYLIGLLGFFDETTSMISAPLIGTLNDKLNRLNYSGSKIIQSSSFLILSIALFGYGFINSRLVPDMFIFRCVFAIGVTGVMSMITVLLNELTLSDFELRKLLFWKNSVEYQPVDESNQVDVKTNGKFSAIMGVSTGLGAIVSVSVLVTLPVKLANSWDIDMKWGLKYSYLIVMFFAIISFAMLMLFLYDNNKIPQQELTLDEEKRPYLEILKQGIEFSKHNKQAQYAYVGALVARSTTVATSMFIPLLVYNWYYNVGDCKIGNGNWAGKISCYDGYIFSAILTGVAQTIALVSAPLWGYLIDSPKFGKFKTLALSGLIGAIGNLGLSFINNDFKKYNPKTFTCFLFVSIIGLSQIGLVISSMSVLSAINNAHDIMGSLSGLYSFSGGIGIMIITLVGGFISDYWILGPFFILGLLNLLILVTFYSFMRGENYKQDFEDEDNGVHI
ncbi:unnamed protein product [Candida verbasci]|uniref:Major facilitator superfamily (MFS) profile domain-containing protein n=1 Tax=Candida verbasci TaxID=1227364 RepID=A0A9W4TWF1_9ASCO|nr:unnamed protein product [Candida verbasci]